MVYVITKLQKLHYVYSNPRKLPNIQILRMIYFAIKVYSIIQYNFLEQPGIIASNNKILRDQKIIIKLILNKPKTYSSVRLFKEFKIFTVQQLFFRIS